MNTLEQRKDRRHHRRCRFLSLVATIVVVLWLIGIVLTGAFLGGTAVLIATSTESAQTTHDAEVRQVQEELDEQALRGNDVVPEQYDNGTYDKSAQAAQEGYGE